ncbi:LANO_0E11012g1_1 [Lachancea nothofagi CBS 11611]|uniref:LANO_0E11012g1_1 n=1 Tax=Lachancea nothofagi CBS 11611 TaxID=1266666 RepID=A0A1G4JX47_9SACH|nr:LANO_0E11012g1_1 [Lachancea nothofagi CBS 11611]
MALACGMGWAGPGWVTVWVGTWRCGMRDAGCGMRDLSYRRRPSGFVVRNWTFGRRPVSQRSIVGVRLRKANASRCGTDRLTQIGSARAFRALGKNFRWLLCELGSPWAVLVESSSLQRGLSSERSGWWNTARVAARAVRQLVPGGVVGPLAWDSGKQKKKKIAIRFGLRETKDGDGER